jgi:hypothetical protein
MKALLSTLLISLSLSTLGYYDDLPEVVDLANSGDFVLIENSQNCPKHRWAPKNQKDQIRGDKGSLCVEFLPLPKEVSFEVSMMEEAELENESDYDQRITSVLAFKRSDFLGAQASLESLKEFAIAMNIPHSHLDTLAFNSEVASERTFSRFDELFLGMTFKSNSLTHKFLVESFKGQNVQVVTFGDGVELYPGGGFYVTHYLFISSDKAVYVKLSWWNS